MSAESSTSEIRFDGYTLILETGILLHGEREIPLRPQTCDVLEYLVRHAGQLVSKEDLLEAVWPGRIVTDQSVTQCVKEIRAAIDDADRTKLKTLPRRGYLFDMPVRAGKVRQAARRKYALVGAGVAMLFALAYFLFVNPIKSVNGIDSQVSPPAVTNDTLSDSDANATGAAPLPQDDRASIAVLPFKIRGDDHGPTYFADGIHDELITTLARIDTLKVISRTSVMAYRDEARSLPEIARELGVRHILEGGVDHSGDQVRINVQLIDAATDAHLWAEHYDRELTAENLFAIRNEISQAVADALQTTLSAENRSEISGMPTTDLAAYEAYMRGRMFVTQRDSQELQRAIDAFKKAVERDPGFALAWVGLADSYGLLAENGTLMQSESWLLRQEAIDRALSIDPELGEAYASLGLLAYHKVVDGLTENVEAAEIAFKKAIELRPNYPMAYNWYSIFLNAAFPERIDESIDLIQKAADLDPQSIVIAVNLGAAYRFRGLLLMAERQFLKALELNPEFARLHHILANLYLDLGRFAQAHAHAMENVRLDPGNLSSFMRLGEVYLELGDLAGVGDVVAQMQALDREHVLTGLAELNLAEAQGLPQQTRTAAGKLLEDFGQIPEVIMYIADVQLVMGDVDAARTVLERLPDLLDRSRWRSRVRANPIMACRVGWIFMRYGDEQFGQYLLELSIKYLEEELLPVREHVDMYQPEICYLAAGDTGRALQVIEVQLQHNHLAHWIPEHRSPIYDPIRDVPRYQAAMAERNRRVDAERIKVKDMKRPIQ